MAHKGYLWMLGLGTVLAFLVFSGVVFFVDPERTGLPGLMAFYASLFLGLGGLGTLVVILLKNFLGRKTDKIQSDVELRRGFLFALYVCGLAIIAQAGYYVWWVAGLYLVLILLIELNYLTRIAKRKS